jgi:hypothetical protein
MTGRTVVKLVSVMATCGLVAGCTIGGTGARPSPQVYEVPPVSPTPTVAPVPSNSTLAVYDGLNLNGNGHVVYLVAVRPDDSARLLATADAAARTGFPTSACPGYTPGGLCTGALAALPYVSLSKTTIYFLDGDSTLRAMARDGSVTKVGSLPGSTYVRVAFAVSPDDKRMAVAVIDYSKAPVSDSLYVDDLQGGARVDLLAVTKPPYYWPVGWHGGMIVLASGPAYGGWPDANQYGASGYSLIDPTPGAQPAAVGPGDCIPTGSLTTAGTACISKPGTKCLSEDRVHNTQYYTACLRRLDWNGGETVFPLYISEFTRSMASTHAALSNDGHAIITDELFLALEPTPDGLGGLETRYDHLQSNEGVTVPTYIVSLPLVSGIGWINPHLVSMMFINSSNNTAYQRIYWISPEYQYAGNVPFDGYASGSDVPTSPVVGSLIGPLPGGL